MTTEEPTPIPTPPAPPVETTTKPVSTANVINAITIVQMLIASMTSFLGVIQASASVFGPEKMGLIVAFAGATIAALQGASSVLNASASSKTQS